MNPTEDNAAGPNLARRRAATAWAGLGIWLLVCFAPATTSAVFPTGEWYASLLKPAWNPPDWVFGPVWSGLYAMMAVAVWRVWQEGGFARQRKPLGWFLFQLLLNAAWTPLFFGLHRVGLALANILLLWLAIVACIVTFRAVSPVAALLLVPYLAWVSFAAVLNFSLWRLNG